VNQRLPFDTSVPSPIGRLAQLRSGAGEAVVRDNQSSPVQHLMAPTGKLEEALWETLGGENPPRLLVLTGSAGSGKSATLNHLLQREQSTGAGRIGRHLADATHSDAPDQDQVDKLADFFEPFADDADEPVEPCRLIAMNTGMALRFFQDLKAKPAAPALTALEAVLLTRLGLPHSHSPSLAPSWLDEAVLVVNLDLRSTAGDPGALFDEILRRLDPANPEGVLEGAQRCITCQVQDWCWPMANAVALSSNTGRLALNAAVGEIAVTRGRHLSPRALWDTAAGLALGGLDLRIVEGRDPCSAIAYAAEAGDEALLVQSLACNGSLGPPVIASPLIAEDEASPIAELALRDPSYRPSLRAHKLIADAASGSEETATHTPH
jgi:hypothetical protein